MEKAKRVVIITGAGISTAAGIRVSIVDDVCVCVEVWRCVHDLSHAVLYCVVF